MAAWSHKIIPHSCIKPMDHIHTLPDNYFKIMFNIVLPCAFKRSERPLQVILPKP